MNKKNHPSTVKNEKGEPRISYICPNCKAESIISEEHYFRLMDSISQEGIVDIGTNCSACNIVNRFTEISKQIKSRDSKAKSMITGFLVSREKHSKEV